MKLFLHYGDHGQLEPLPHHPRQRPAEVRGPRAMVDVAVSFEMSEYTAEADGVGTLRLLNAIRSAASEKSTRSTGMLVVRASRKVQEIPAEGNHALLPAVALRRRQAVRLPDAHQL